MLAQFVEDAKYALRRLRMSPAFATLIVLTIGLGIGATTAIFSVVNAVVLRPIPLPNAAQVVRLYETNPGNDAWTTSEPNYLDFRDQTRTFAVLSAVTGRSASLLGHGDPISLSGLAATATYFRLFGGKALVGAAYAEDHDRAGGDTHVVLFSEGIWRRVFGADRSVVGSLVDLDGVPYRVLGIMPQGYGYLPSDFWVPLAPDRASNRGNHLLVAFGRMKNGMSIAQANADVRSVAAQLSRVYPKSNGQWGARIESFNDFIVGPDLRRQLMVLLAAVGFLLVLASANVANLLLARASARAREIAVRSALGASTARIGRQLLTESTMLALLGGVVGVLMTWAAIPLLRRASAVNVPRLDEVTIDARVLGFVLGVAVLTGVLFGLAPAMHAVRSDVQSSLREGARSVAGAGRRVRDALVAVEVALAVVLLVGAGLLGRSFVRLGHVSPGFDTSNLLQLTVTAPNDMPRDRRAAYFQQIELALAAIPRAASVGANSIAPFTGGGTNTQFLAEGHEAQQNEYFAADWRSVTPGFFRTLGIALTRGRLLESTDDTNHGFAAVIDEVMASKLWPGQDPLGKHVMAAQSARTAKDQIEVVGVVKDIRDQSLASDPSPAVYFTEAQKPWVQMTFFVRPRSGVGSTGLVNEIRQAMREAAPTTPVPDITPLATNIDVALAPQRFTAALLGGFATIALVLAAIGIYGVISFSVQQRTSEMGVRLALGATPGRVARMVVRDSALLVGIGAAIGTAGAAALSRLIASLLFATAPSDVPTYGAAIAALLGVAVLASLLPARRAARTDPLIAMRES